jgi:uncharacterized protein (DUF736 family)
VVERKKENGKKYLAGEIDLGILGRKQAYLFKNTNREKDSNQPHYRLVIREGENWKEVGAFWIRESKVKEEDVDFA